ncbi:MAG: phosphoribosyltransferase family protein [Candidatus Marisimplicoccus sp.]|tara:strand:- start:948 stop:1448 length:501 start_codon:yes stop_codon:yes gene_type:complete
MKKNNLQNIILDNIDVKNKIQRISLEILEDNIDEKKIIFFGISDNGKIIAKRIITNINKISKINLDQINVNINNINDIKFDKNFNANKISLVIVSDVSYSAKTLQLVISKLINYNPSKIKTAVMINRDHSLFPVKINFSGLNLSTSVNEHVDVEVNRDNEFTVYLN